MQIDIRTDAPAKVSAIQYADEGFVVPIYDTDSISIVDEDESECSVDISDLDNLIKALERAKELILEGERVRA